MGFDTYLTRDDLEGAEKIRRYISDRAVYKVINETIDENREPVFAFTVTMQNHGDYKDGSYQSDISVLDGKYPEADQFLGLIRESDRALEELVTHYAESSEKTIIVMFGDHLPSLPKAFYKEYNGFTKDSSDISEQILYYETNYIIWANYDLPEEESLTSLNYLGLHLLKLSGSKLNAYQMYLSELEEQIPAFSAYGWFDKDGTVHAWDSDAEVEDLISLYDSIEYNALVDTRHRCDSLYELPEETGS